MYHYTHNHAASRCSFRWAIHILASLLVSKTVSCSDRMAVAPIHFAAHTRDVETLRRLLAEGVSPDVAGGDYDRTPLLFLCVSPDAGGDLAACFKLLRDAGANLEAVNRNGFTPLLYAANVANTKIA